VSRLNLILAMNDPHVVSLEYRLETDDTLKFENPPALEHDQEGFAVRLADGLLTVTMKDHYATQAEAVAAVRPFIRAWELFHGLERGRCEFCFRFVRSNIIDRKPTPGTLDTVLLAAAGTVTITGSAATLTLTHRQYPDAPTGFVASPDVETLWNRYENHRLGREPLPSMAYFCLTVVESRYGGRGNAAAALNIDRAVLERLGLLTTKRGDATTARKREGKALQPLTAQEERWIHEALRLMIRRVGAEQAAALPSAPLTMADLPRL
jgi:hypothetical protein